MSVYPWVDLPLLDLDDDGFLLSQAIIRLGYSMFFKNQRIGKYQILDTIGTGGFGSVYLAKDTFIDKMVAIKVPHKQGENVEKLLREPKMLAVLNHPHIVSVITAEQTNGVFYIVMEYVDGTSLERHIRSKGALSVEQALTWFIHIGEALAYAHRKKIIHRDIRPANILISKDGQLKVGDFGTSRYLLENPFASTRIGSPPYMAPEHFQGKATYQSDLYSLGVLMYESLTNKLPFYDKNPRILAKIAQEGDAPMVHEVNDACPTELSEVIARAMHPKLIKRHNNADHLIADLKKVRLAYQVSQSQDLGPLKEVPHTRPEPVRARPEPPRARPEPIPRQEPQQVIREPRQDIPRAQPQKRPEKKPFFPKDIPTREISSLFCWNCSRPIQKRTRNCPHCNVSLK